VLDPVGLQFEQLFRGSVLHGAVVACDRRTAMVPEQLLVASVEFASPETGFLLDTFQRPLAVFSDGCH
jgi:hypothetical protein